MKGLQGLFVLAEILMLVGGIFVCLHLAFYFLRKPKSIQRNSVFFGLVILVCFLMTLAFNAQSNFPGLDFVYRCGPNGTGLCINGETFGQVENEILYDHIQLFIDMVIIPVLLWTGLQSVFLIRALQKKIKNMQKEIIERDDK